MIKALGEHNLHSFRSSFSTIMRGIANLRADARFSGVHAALDMLIDAVPVHSAHLLKADTSLLHYLRCLRFRSTPARAQFVRQTFDVSQLDTVRRACIECWRGWRDSGAFNYLRNRWQQLTPECQRQYWLASFVFGDEGDKARSQARRAARQSWALGVELPFDEDKDKEKLSKLPRGGEPRFATVFIDWSKTCK